MNESTLVPREEMNDLDWLALNVHVWPTSTPHIVTAGDGVFEFGATFCENHVCVYHREFTDSKVIYKKQWLARRAELQNKPSWDHEAVPAWATALAQDQDGEWKWLGDNVTQYVDGFTADKISAQCKGVVLGSWRNTLEKRQEQAEFEPFVSVEDAATAKQPTPKGSGKPILGMVLTDLTNRALEGKEKYGEPLLAHNGRNALWDLYQELLDAAMYIRQAIEEQKQ